ncbi:hypothetical protein N7499_001593 [Penicillium canescens]|uniref:Plastocyanin-like domain-containing protein n=1 Tax=Penicillium canescens TaxID=5083 RepID=A0AAD6N6B0_PENCN|nr:hypothetical protein N7460_008562 [Penicillium canescens]KAJ6046048.1 hypothetical protein N7444_007302 [Penicillium canescens]KAJ6097219.1 hypothetical protein N7499_001593 [Penicillium canescens]
MHKHPNKAFILGVGPGFFNWSSTEEEAYAERPELLQVENPQMRDTSVANGPTGPTWMIVRYQVVNPGPFLFHCHIETQMSNGMTVALLNVVDVWPQLGKTKAPVLRLNLLARVLLIKAAHLSSLTLTCQFLVESLRGLPHLNIAIVEVDEDFPPMPVEVNPQPAPPIGRAYQARRW